MRLLYIHQYFVFPQQAGGTRSYDLSRKFIENGIDVTIITTSAAMKDLNNTKNKRWIYLEREGIKLWILNCAYNQKMSIPRRIMSFVKFMWFTSIKAIKIKADVVLATSTPLTVAIPALIKKLFCRTPYIFEARDIWPEAPIQLGYVKNKLLIKFLRWTEKFIYRNSAYLVVLSDGMKKDVESRIKVPYLEVIPNLCTIERFGDTSNKFDLDIDLNSKKVVLFTGAMGPANRIMYVAELAKKLHDFGHDDIIFLLIGDGSDKASIMKYCEENCILNHNIFFMDNVPKIYMPYIYSLATIGSSFKLLGDNSANKFFDTLAAAKPILINYGGWQAELIDRENCGYVLPVHIENEDILNFINYLHDDELLIKQGQNAYKVAIEQFSIDIAREKYLKVIDTVVNKQSRNK